MSSHFPNSTAAFPAGHVRQWLYKHREGFQLEAKRTECGPGCRHKGCDGTAGKHCRTTLPGKHTLEGHSIEGCYPYHHRPEPGTAIELDPDNRPGLLSWVEGEPCGDALREIGVEAITSIGGASNVHLTDYSRLKGRHVMVVPDDDAPGHKAGFKVAKKLEEAGAKVFFPDVPLQGTGKDIADYEPAERLAQIREWMALPDKRDRQLFEQEAAADEPLPADYPRLVCTDIMERFFLPWCEGRLAWDTDQSLLRRYTGTYWETCDWDAVVNAWCAPEFMARVTAPIDMPHASYAHEVIGLMESAQWTGAAVMARLKARFKAVRGREFKPMPRHRLNCLDGVVDMLTGAYESTDHSDAYLYCMPFDRPPAWQALLEDPCPFAGRWQQMVLAWMNEAEESARYLQTLLGGGASGAIQRVILWICGPGSTGKSTFLEFIDEAICGMAVHLEVKDAVSSKFAQNASPMMALALEIDARIIF